MAERKGSRLVRIEDKLGSISDTQIRQQAVLEGLADSVHEHIKRTNLLEAAMEANKKEAQVELKPIIAHVNMVNGALKLLGVLAMVLPILEFLWRTFHKN